MRTLLNRFTLPLPCRRHAGSDRSGERPVGTGRESRKKMLVKVMSIENGDTTITERQVDPNDPDVRWVERTMTEKKRTSG